MSVREKCNPAKACLMLLVVTVFWGASFVLMKALGQTQQKTLPNASSWFLSSFSLLVRFGLAALVLLIWNRKNLRHITRLEIRQGVVLGIFGGVGILFQMDGVMHTSASTSAFLTQCYCIFIPVLVACKKRAWPSKTIAFSCAMALAGVAALSQINWREFRIGRGELEAVLSSIFFTGQILCLERPVYSANKSSHVTTIMCGIFALIALPVVVLSTAHAGDLLLAYQTPVAIGMVVFLTIACTIVAYSLMNFWQPHISAISAGLIYCSEPLFTSVFALFCPAYLSTLAKINYPNESFTLRLLIGGGLITAANILIIAQAARTKTPLVPAIPIAAEKFIGKTKETAVH